MSGESVAVVGVVAGVGAVALLGAAGASCALVVGGSLRMIGSQLERRQAGREAEQADRTEWDHVLTDVALVNGRIGVFRAALDEAAAAGQARTAMLPAPLVLGAQTIAELRQWCADARPRLDQAETSAAEQTALAILRRADVLAGLKDVRTGLDGPGGQAADPAPAGSAAAALRGGEALRGDILRVGRQLRAGVSAQDHEAVARAARRALTAGSRTEALNRLGDMRVRVDQANAAADVRRAHAVEAAGLLQPLAPDDQSAHPLREELLRVVAGAAPLTDALRAQAEQAAAERQQAADRRYVRESVIESLVELGYAVDQGFQTAIPVNGILHVTRSEWSVHGVRLALDDEKGELRAVVVRTEDAGSWDASRVDTQREEQWCAARKELEVLLAAKNITMRVRSLTEPGAKPVRVVRRRPGPEGGAAMPSVVPRTGR